MTDFQSVPWSIGESNSWPFECHSNALPTELIPRFSFWDCKCNAIFWISKNFCRFFQCNVSMQRQLFIPTNMIIFVCKFQPVLAVDGMLMDFWGGRTYILDRHLLRAGVRTNGIQKVRSSILPCSQNRLKISHLRHLRINLRIKLAEFMRNFFYYPPLYFDCFWAGPTGELSGNPPRHTSG